MKKIISIVLVLLILIASFFLYQNLISNQEKESQKSEPSKVENTKKIKIVAIGDSLTAGYGLNISESYPSQLEKKLLENNLNVEVINMGVSGETTAGLLERVEFIKKQKPEIILITIGGNDALRALPPNETEKNITKVVQSLKQMLDGEQIFLANIQAPGNLGLSYTNKFNVIFENISDEQNIHLMEFVVPEVFTQIELMQGDRIHPNAQGYEIIVDKYILPKILQQLNKK